MALAFSNHSLVKVLRFSFFNNGTSRSPLISYNREYNKGHNLLIVTCWYRNNGKITFNLLCLIGLILINVVELTIKLPSIGWEKIGFCVTGKLRNCSFSVCTKHSVGLLYVLNLLVVD